MSIILPLEEINDTYVDISKNKCNWRNYRNVWLSSNLILCTFVAVLFCYNFEAVL